MTQTITVADDLVRQFGLTRTIMRYGLSQDELFNAAIANDRGRIRPDGPDDDQKAYATAMGVDGPLMYYTDPTCTGRPVKDTFAVARPEVVDTVWWKPDFQQFDPDAFDALLPRVIHHLNDRRSTLYITDVACGADSKFAVPYRFIGEYATHAYFCNVMFPSADGVERGRDSDGWTLINVPSFRCDPERDGTLTERAVIIDIANRVGLVLGRAD